MLRCVVEQIVLDVSKAQRSS